MVEAAGGTWLASLPRKRKAAAATEPLVVVTTPELAARDGDQYRRADAAVVAAEWLIAAVLAQRVDWDDPANRLDGGDGASDGGSDGGSDGAAAQSPESGPDRHAAPPGSAGRGDGRPRAKRARRPA